MEDGDAMLGWGIHVYKASEPETSNWKDCIAFWETGIDGDTWLRENCELTAENGGYPVTYRTNGKFVKAMLGDGPVTFVSRASIIHEEDGSVEHAGQPGWIGRARIDYRRLTALKDEEVISIDAWDLS